MPGPYRRKRMHDGHTRLRRRLRLRNKTKDLDQVVVIISISVELAFNPTKYFVFMSDRLGLEDEC